MQRPYLTSKPEDESMLLIISNLSLAGILTEKDIQPYLRYLLRMDNAMLVLELVNSRYLLDSYLGWLVEAVRN